MHNGGFNAQRAALLDDLLPVSQGSTNLGQRGPVGAMQGEGEAG